MVDQGLLEETEGLLSGGFSPELKSMKALGYRHAVKVLRGEWDLAGAVERLQGDTRRYAKRQLTWFRADPEALWVRPTPLERIIETIQGFLGASA
jgi:tRNA dimethylallyltransferase